MRHILILQFLRIPNKLKVISKSHVLPKFFDHSGNFSLLDSDLSVKPGVGNVQMRTLSVCLPYLRFLSTPCNTALIYLFLMYIQCVMRLKIKKVMLSFSLYNLTSGAQSLDYIIVSIFCSKSQIFHDLNDYITYVIWVANHL